jgi:DNA-binding response OmpR family regulator
VPLKNSPTMSIHGDILLVEDEPAIVDFMQRVLVRGGYAVRTAADGAQALAALTEHLPAVLILDLVLPGISGFAVLEHVDQNRLDLSVIVISANPLMHNALRVPAIRRYLVKPFRVDELLDAVVAAGLRHRAI